MKQVYEYECGDEYEKWEANIEVIHFNQNITSFIVRGRGSLIRGYLSNALGELSVSFPDYERCTTLTKLDEVCWNMRQLISLFDNCIDGESVAMGLYEIFRKANDLLPE